VKCVLRMNLYMSLLLCLY